VDRARTLEALIAERGGGVVARLDGPPVTEGDADVAVAHLSGRDLAATVAHLCAAIRPGGTAVLVTPAAGLWGLGGGGAPAPADACAALLSAGLVEIGTTLTPGTLRRERLVWGQRRLV
jgi:hypothetical protein